MKIKFNVKGQDDAIQESGVMLNKVNQLIDQFMREFDKMLQMTTEKPEFKINFNERSPFKLLNEKQQLNREIVTQAWKELPRFMYFPDELVIFEKEYEEILATLLKFEKEQTGKTLEKTIAFIEKLPEDEQRKDDRKRVYNFVYRIKKKIEKTGIADLPNIDAVKNLKDLVSALKPFVQTLRA